MWCVCVYVCDYVHMCRACGWGSHLLCCLPFGCGSSIKFVYLCLDQTGYAAAAIKRHPFARRHAARACSLTHRIYVRIIHIIHHTYKHKQPRTPKRICTHSTVHACRVQDKTHRSSIRHGTVTEGGRNWELDACRSSIVRSYLAHHTKQEYVYIFYIVLYTLYSLHFLSALFFSRLFVIVLQRALVSRCGVWRRERQFCRRHTPMCALSERSNNNKNGINQKCM